VTDRSKPLTTADFDAFTLDAATTVERTPGSLKPRAVAVLVALRGGPLTSRQLCAALRDSCEAHTLSLLDDMRTGRVASALNRLWYLDEVGVAWLEINNLACVTRAKYYPRAVAAVREAPSLESVPESAESVETW